MKNSFTVRLSELIAEKGATQNKICSDLHIRKQKLSNWKTGYTEPCLDELIMLALYFHVTVDYLLGVEEETGIR